MTYEDVTPEGIPTDLVKSEDKTLKLSSFNKLQYCKPDPKDFVWPVRWASEENFQEGLQKEESAA